MHHLSTLNWFAILAAAVSSFLIGGLWYSPLLFANRWMKENNFTAEDMKKGNMAKTFGLSLLFSIVMAYILYLFLDPNSHTTAGWGAMLGFHVGFGFAAMTICVTGQFERRSTVYMLIHSGYFIVSFTVMGLILGAWS